MNNAHTKLFLVIMLSCILLMSLLGIGITLWAAWLMYTVGAMRSCALLCVCAGAFLFYQARIVFKNKSEILNDLKEVWRGGKLDA